MLQTQAQDSTLGVVQTAARLDALVATAMESTITTNILTETPATVKLDALVNSTVETHIGSPPTDQETPSPDPPTIPISRPVPNLVLENIISQEPAQQPPVLSPTHKNMPPVVAFKNILLNPTPDVGFINQPTPMEIAPMPISPTVIQHPASIFPTPSILSATNNAVPQQQILSPTNTQPNIFMQQFEQKSPVPASPTAPIIPIPVKELQSTQQPEVPVIPTSDSNTGGVIKEQRLITQEITNMSDTDLLSYINPSCFDQGEC